MPDEYHDWQDTVMGFLSNAATAYRESGAADDDFLRDARLAVTGQVVSIHLGVYSDDLLAAAGHWRRASQDAAGFLDWCREAWRLETGRAA